MNDNLKRRLTSRKLWVMMVWQTVFCVLLWFGKLPVEAFVSLTWLLLGGYLAANVTQGAISQKLDTETLKVLKS